MSSNNLHNHNLYNHHLKIEKDIEICENKIKNLKKLKIAEEIVMGILEEDPILFFIWNNKLNNKLNNRLDTNIPHATPYQ